MEILYIFLFVYFAQSFMLIPFAKTYGWEKKQGWRKVAFIFLSIPAWIWIVWISFILVCIVLPLGFGCYILAIENWTWAKYLDMMDDAIDIRDWMTFKKIEV